MVKNYTLLGLIIAGLIIFGAVVYYFRVSQKTAAEVAQIYMTPQTQVNPSASGSFTQWLSVSFEGKLPCADCEGIREELTLTKTSVDKTSGIYFLKDTYLGKSTKPFETEGKWTSVKGSAGNPDATVYQLTDPAGEVSYYLLVDEKTLKQLDKQKKEIDAPFNMSLTRE